MSTLETLKKGEFIEESDIKKFQDQVAENMNLRERLDKELQAWLSDYYKSSSSQMSSAILTNLLLFLSYVLLQKFVL
jgi:hypothetical protein